MLAFTDPLRTPDPLALARRLPPSAALVYRAFGAPDAEAVAAQLAAALHRRGALLLIGADAALAASVGADGVHLPERAVADARWIKAKHPGWIVTVAAHSRAGARRARAARADAAVVSAVFASSSASAGAPIGAIRLAMLVLAAGLPIYALGGVSDRSAGRLKDLRLAGLAAVEAFRT